MSLQYTIDAFRTKQVLDKSYRSHAKSFELEKWWGEYNKAFDYETVKYIIHSFNTSRDKYYDLVHTSAYRYTYKSKGLPMEVYLKHYRVMDARYSKTTIIKRNILRRTIGKKSFALTFKLSELAIPTIESILYAGDKGNYICKEGLYVSSAIPNSVSLYFYINSLFKIKPKDGFSDFFKSSAGDLPLFSLNTVFDKYNEFILLLIDKGIRASHSELFGNTLIQFEKNNFRLTLCDLDAIDAISPYSSTEKELAKKRSKEFIEEQINKLKNINDSYF